MSTAERSRFRGRIAGVGSTSGTRVVVGRWHESPLGAFCDAMIETGDGRRVLVAPNQEAADFIAATYEFDEVRIEPIDAISVGSGWQVTSPSLDLALDVGRRTPLGWGLWTVPTRLAQAPAWSALLDPIAQWVMPGVRTRGTAGQGRREWYGATDHHRVTAARGGFDGESLGDLAEVDPPCRFGFSSVPRVPSVTSVVTTVQVG